MASPARRRAVEGFGKPLKKSTTFWIERLEAWQASASGNPARSLDRSASVLKRQF
jgi:hypothetical protein